MLRASIDSIARRSNSMNNIYSSEYTGYVYIWYDTKSKFFYIGGHYGKVDDAYICSNKPMKRAYNIRPTTFRFKVLEYTIGTTKDLRILEQKWLDKIKDSELMISENVQKGSCRYYNVKKTSSGGNGAANKGKSHSAWNKGYDKEEMRLRKQGLLCFIVDKPKIQTLKKSKIRKTPMRNKGLKVSKQLRSFICKACKCEFTSINDRKTCSLSCAGKIAWNNGTAVPGFKKNQTAWNKGLPNSASAENGRKSAAKLSAKVKGRKLARREDGSRYWTYPNESGEIG